MSLLIAASQRTLYLIEIDKFIYWSGSIYSSRIIAYRIPLAFDSFACGHSQIQRVDFFELVFRTSEHDADINLSFRLTFWAYSKFCVRMCLSSVLLFFSLSLLPILPVFHVHFETFLVSN